MSIKPIPMMLAVLLIAAVPSKAAEKADPAMQKMREAVKNSMIQLRDANAKLATAQAAQAEALLLYLRMDAVDGEFVGRLHEAAGAVGEEGADEVARELFLALLVQDVAEA